MSEKTRDLLLALLGLIFICIGLTFVFTRVIGDVRDLAPAPQMVDPADREPAITPGTPPDVPVPEGGAPARSDSPASWITNDDYPFEALRNEWQGTVTIRWVIGTTGRVTDCYVVESSGHGVLDEAACRLIKRNGRYEQPARDAAGRPIPSSDQRRVVWRLPE